MDSIKKEKHEWWFSITDLASAHKAAQQGLLAPTFIIGLTLFSIITNEIDVDFLGNDLGLLINFGTLVLIAFGIYKKFRIAPILGIVLYLLPAVLFSADPYGLGVAVGIFVLLFYINSARGIYYWHKYKKAEVGTP